MQWILFKDEIYLIESVVDSIRKPQRYGSSLTKYFSTNCQNMVLKILITIVF